MGVTHLSEFFARHIFSVFSLLKKKFQMQNDVPHFMIILTSARNDF